AKKTVEVREHHAGVNRNRARRLIRAIGIAVFGAFLISLFSSGSTKEKFPIDKISIGTAVPVVGALPNATRVGHIAVIKIDGGIAGTLHGAPVASNTPLYLETAFAAAETDPDLAGVILEIDSPGGGAAESFQSYRIVKAARERLSGRGILTIAYTSLGAYSGGYYIAMAVGKGNFFADPGAGVASIGVIMSMFNTAGLGERFGVTENIVKTGPLKSTGAQWEKLSQEQRKMLQESVNDTFDLFLTAVAEGRGLDFAVLVRESQLPEGRTNGGVFSAKRALEKELIDGIIPVEMLYRTAASAVPDPERFNRVEFVEYRARPGVVEQLTMSVGRASGIFLKTMFSEMTNTNAPMRSERR
ncbi:MAG: S49 family peptidase, partial [Patescibacteria group bacterium]